MKLLVTGGAGFIGSHVVEQALAAGHQVGVLDNLSTGKRENVAKQARFWEVDLRSREATEGVLAEFKPDVVSHQAAQASVSVSARDPGLDAEINILGGIHLLDACVANQVGRVVFASTGGAIYGEVDEPELAREEWVPKPYSPYAISKLTMENLLHFYRTERGLEYTTLRYANVYGPRQDAFGEAGVIAIFAERIFASQSIQVNARREVGDAGCVRDYVAVGDVARANLKALAGELDARVMNVGTGVATTTLDLARAILRHARREVPINHAERRAGDLERSVLDPTLCRRVLGTTTSLDVGLAQTVAWYAASHQS
jgi:UDP-glucose 4-epimerase